MAIVFDNTAFDSPGGNQTSFTFSHTIGVGSNPILLVAVRVVQQATDQLAGVTYNGVSMTRINALGPHGTDNEWCYLYLVTNPTIGANNVIVSANSAIAMLAASVSYTGVSQSGQPDNSITYVTGNSDNQGGTTAAISLTPKTNNCWVFCAGVINTDTFGSPGAGTTSRNSSSAAAALDVCDNNAAISPAASTTLNLTTLHATQSMWEVIMISLAPFSAGGSLSSSVIGGHRNILVSKSGNI